METWRVIDSGKGDAAYNMALDEAVATHVRRGHSQPTLRLYGWENPSVSLGSFQKITDVNSDYCTANNIAIVRRPTGGRAILHGDELTYSFCSRNKNAFSHGLMETYLGLSRAFASALVALGLDVEMKTVRESGQELTRSPICFRSSSYGEISIDAKKLVGSAQKRWIDGFLQQGSVPYSIDHAKLESVFISDSSEAWKDGRAEGTERLRVDKLVGLRELMPDFNHELKAVLIHSFERNFGITLEVSRPSVQEEELALQLSSQKYQDPHWTLGASVNMRYCNSNGIAKRALQD